jgi:hypothetical protein
MQRITFPTGMSSRVVCEYLARQLRTPLPLLQLLLRTNLSERSDRSDLYFETNPERYDPFEKE